MDMPVVICFPSSWTCSIWPISLPWCPDSICVCVCAFVGFAESDLSLSVFGFAEYVVDNFVSSASPNLLCVRLRRVAFITKGSSVSRAIVRHRPSREKCKSKWVVFADLIFKRTTSGFAKQNLKTTSSVSPDIV